MGFEGPPANMTRRTPTILRVCLAATLVVWLYGCASPPKDASPTETLRIGVGSSIAADAQRVLTELLYAEPLLAIDWSGRPLERLVANWGWEDDGRTLRLKLRPNVKLHDGRLLTAAVVVKILRREWEVNKPRGFTYLQKIETPDQSSVVLYLSRPDTFLLDALEGTMMVEGDIGTGPFRLVSRTPAIEAERNQEYYRGTPGVARVRIVPYDTQRAAWAAMMRGDVDGVQEVNRESLDFLEGASAIEKYPSIRPFYISVIFNLRHPMLRRVEVRRALAEAVNREEIVRLAMRGHGLVADDPIWPYNWAYSAATRRYTYNPKAAGLRLDAAALPIRPQPVGSGQIASRFRIACLFWEDGPQFERIALYLQRQLAAVGVDLVLEPTSLPELRQRVRVGNFDAYLMQLNSGRTFDRNYDFWHSPTGSAAFQDTGYNGVDDILDRLRVGRSETEIRGAVADLRQRFYEDAPAAFLAWPETTRAIDARFDVGDRTDPDIFANLWRWRPVSAQQASK
jgi:ABC-type transport system substrate-binding protein